MERKGIFEHASRAREKFLRSRPLESRKTPFWQVGQNITLVVDSTLESLPFCQILDFMLVNEYPEAGEICLAFA